MIIAPGTTSRSVDVQIVDDSGAPVTGLVAATFPPLYYSVGDNTASTQITPLSDLAAITTAFTAKGVKERTGSAGMYRVDVPDAAFAAAGLLTIYGEASGKHLFVPGGTINVGYVQSDVRKFFGTSTLDVGNFTGAVFLAMQNGLATQTDINNLNQSASRRVLLQVVPQFERPESGSSTYTVVARVYDPDGAATNGTGTPTLTATGKITGSLAANLSAATNPAAGVWKWTYTVASGATAEEITFDVAAPQADGTWPMSALGQVVDLVASTFTTADRAAITAIQNKLPSKAFLAGTANSDGDVQMDEATGNYPGTVGGVVAGATLTSGERTAVAAALLASLVEAGFTVQDVLKLCGAAAAAKVSGASGTTPVIRNLADTLNRITATTDASGNRSAVAYNLG